MHCWWGRISSACQGPSSYTKNQIGMIQIRENQISFSTYADSNQTENSKDRQQEAYLTSWAEERVRGLGWEGEEDH